MTSLFVVWLNMVSILEIICEIHVTENKKNRIFTGLGMLSKYILITVYFVEIYNLYLLLQFDKTTG